MFNGGLRGKKLYSKKGIRDARDKTVLEIPTVQVEYVVIAGGGGGGGSPGTRDMGGGGGGGYRSSVVGDASGGGASAESYFILKLYTDYTVTIGAGGANGAPSVTASNGSNSIFHTILSQGGGRGTGYTPSGSGGSGGGGSGYTPGLSPTPGSPGTANQGYAGGEYGYFLVSPGVNYSSGGGGGGAGGDGRDGGAINPLVTNSIGGSGGLGVDSRIFIAPTYVINRGGGGGGGSRSVDQQGLGYGGGGSGGGPAPLSGNYTFVGLNGDPGFANYGGGGGGTGAAAAGGSGGSGVVNLRYRSNYTITASAGLTISTVVRENYKITTISAGTGTISWS